MVKFLMQGKNGPIVGVGITEENVKKLKKEMPIHVKGNEMGIGVDIVIIYGKDLDNLKEQLKPLIGDNTSIIDTSQLDPNDKDVPNKHLDDPRIRWTG